MGGLEGFEANSWYGMYAPAAVAPEIVARVNEEVNRILALPEVREGLANLGGRPLVVSPAELRAKAQSDSARFAALIRKRNIRVN